jgi:Replication-relaxation
VLASVLASVKQYALFHLAARDAALLVLAESGQAGPLDRAVRYERLRRLLRWRESGERWACYPHFPPLLVLTSSVRAREHWQQCAQQVAAEHRLPPLNGAVLVLPPQRVIHQVAALACQRLAPPGPCSLSELLLPTPRAAALPEVLAPRTVPAGTFDLGEAPRRRRLVGGGFAQRAARLDGSAHLAGERRGTNREEVALLSLRLHQRHQRVLAHLLAAPLLSRQEMTHLCAITPATLARTLYDLRQWDLVVPYPGPRGLRLALSERGCRLLAAQMGVSLPHLAERSSGQQKAAWVQRGVGALLRVLFHTSGLYGFLMRLARAAHTSAEHGDRLLWWEVGARCSRSYRLHGRICTILPDAAFAYRREQQTTRAVLEWDSGSMAGRDLAIKLCAYRRYVASRAWLSESPVLPRLLFVAPDPGQERRIQRVAQGLLADSTLAIYTTTATRLAEQGPLSPIWWLMQPDSSGGSGDRRSWLISGTGS